MTDITDFKDCNKCKELTGMYFKRQYSPIDYLHGKRNSKVWIIGINPYGDIGQNDNEETIDKLIDFKIDNSYFKDFENVSKCIFDALGKENGVAHTDLIKCFSTCFPPINLNKNDLYTILCNCRVYLKEQLDLYKPKVIICNGKHVVWHVEQLVPPNEDFGTFYYGNLPYKTIVFRSGFIGRIDNYAKRRLGKEIEKALIDLQILTLI